MTLVETVVVMTILFLLSALLLPVFAGARKAAQATVCVSNLHQIYLALEIYHDDFGEYPKQGRKAFLPYVGGRYALQCPEVAGQGVFNSYGLTAYDGPQSISAYTGPVVGLKEFLECREKRGSAMPLAFDDHHIELPEVLSSDGNLGGFVLVLRASGSVDHVSRNRYAEVQAISGGATGLPKVDCAPEFYANNL